MAGAIFPILPGALAIYAAFFVYGFFISFSPFGFWFWTIQTLIVAALFIADYAVNAWGVKRFGGSRASVIGSTVGVIVGPFAIPAFGLLLGPLIGAIIGELFAGASFDKSLKVGFGSVVGLFSSMVVKIILQAVMIVLFIIWI
ncbi:DUF456 domain-containing protein [Paenibacillus spongiae]